MRKHKILHFLLPAFILAVLLAGGFSCNLITGPHRSSGPDTTSSNFTWTVDTIGASGSYLYDVTIVNDSLAYAVGLLMPSDSVGRSNAIHWDNAAVWNGTKWTSFQVPYYYNGQKTFSTISFTFARNQDDVWFGFVYWDGSKYSQDLPGQSFNSQATKMWESPDGSQLYVVGYKGSIAYSPDHGATWQQVQTGTTLPFQDIWGDGGRVLAVGSDKFGSGGQYLVQLNGNTATHLTDTVSAQESLSSIWFHRNQKYFVEGSGIFERDSLPGSGPWSGPYRPVDWYSYAVRGQAANDVIAVGESASISHFDVKSWTGFTSLINTTDRLASVAFKDNLGMAVGGRFEDPLHDYAVI